MLASPLQNGCLESTVYMPPIGPHRTVGIGFIARWSRCTNAPCLLAACMCLFAGTKADNPPTNAWLSEGYQTASV